jgi:signal transduction histidine kinase
VSDSGRGFDVEAARGNCGLGLVSMLERVHLVHGRLFVESEPGKGTKIFAIVPLASRIQSSSDDKDADTPAGIIGTT